MPCATTAAKTFVDSAGACAQEMAVPPPQSDRSGGAKALDFMMIGHEGFNFHGVAALGSTGSPHVGQCSGSSSKTFFMSRAPLADGLATGAGGWWVAEPLV